MIWRNIQVTSKPKKWGIEERFSNIKVQPNANRIKRRVRNI